MIAPGRRERARILVVGPSPPPHHGCAVITRNLLDSSLATRFDLVHLDTADRRGIDNIGRLDPGNVALAGVHGARFVKLLTQARPDLVYVMPAQNTWGFLRDALFLGPAALRGVPLVLHFQSGQFDAFYGRAPEPVRALVRSLVPRAARAIVLGRALIPMLSELVPEERIRVVPNAVPDVDVGERTRSERVRVLYLGNLMPGKGYLELIEAVELLAADGVDVEAIFAGNVSDPMAHERALRAAAALPSHIRLVGPVSGAAKQAVLRDADMLVLPSHYENEGHPLVLLEGMAAGLPVISTRYVAIPETVVEGETGLLVDTHDVPGLAAAIRRLAADPALRERMGRAARRRYLEQYTLERWAERLAGIFDDVLAPVREPSHA